jgi:hypothetical protein
MNRKKSVDVLDSEFLCSKNKLKRNNLLCTKNQLMTRLSFIAAFK